MTPDVAALMADKDFGSLITPEAITEARNVTVRFGNRKPKYPCTLCTRKYVGASLNESDGKYVCKPGKGCQRGTDVPVTPPTDTVPKVDSSYGRWTLDTGEILILDSAPFTRREYGSLQFATGTVYRPSIIGGGMGYLIRNPAGEAMRVTSHRKEQKVDAVARVLWEGVVSVDASRLAYEITPDRAINPESGIRTLVVRAIDRNGNVRIQPVAASVTRKQQMTEWLDPLGFVAIESPAMMGKYIRGLADGLPDANSALYGTGPVTVPDGRMLLATPSGCYDTNGDVVDSWVVDLSTMNPARLRDMHDVGNSFTSEQINEGLQNFTTLLNVSKNYPEVTAAHLGQLLVSPLAPIDMRYFAPIYLHGARGIGKTRFESLISAIQSPKERDLDNIIPEVNLGDITGTTKGPKYRVTKFGLGTILTDDVFKQVHSPTVQLQRSETLDAMIRSREAGAAAIGTVDKARNIVSSTSSGQLAVSLRATSEGAPPRIAGNETSLADRVIVQGGWQHPLKWYDIFDRDLFGALEQKDALDSMYAAWSTCAMWVWSNQDLVSVLHEHADTITNSWSLGSARVRDKYAAVVCGLLVYKTVAKQHGLDVSEPVAAAIEALHVAAVKQTAPENTVNLADEFRKELRMAMKAGDVAAVGRPIRVTSGDPDFITPYRIYKDPNDDDKFLHELPAGVGQLSDIGLKSDGAKPRPKKDSATLIYIRPPKRTATGGRNKANEKEWHYLIPTGDTTFAALCRVLTNRQSRNDSAIVFDPDAVIAALTAISPDFKAKVRYYAIANINDDGGDGIGIEDQKASTQSCIVIPTAWLHVDETEV